MGKSLIIKGADFSANGIKIREYLLSTDEIISNANNGIVLTACGYGYVNQDAIRGKNLIGIKAKVLNAGSLRIFKATATDITLVTTQQQLTLVTTISTSTTGIQEIMFEEPIVLGENEYLIFGDPQSFSVDTLRCYYSTITSTNGAYYLGTTDAKISPNPFDIAVAFIAE